MTKFYMLRGLLLNANGGDGNGGNANGGNGDAAAAIKAAVDAAVKAAKVEATAEMAEQLKKAQQLSERAKALEDENATLKTKVTELTASVTQITDQLAAFKSASSADGKIDVAKAIETAVSTALARQGESLQQELADLRGQLDKEAAARAKLQLDSRRNQLIAEAGGDSALIVDLVTGDTEEEISASIARAKEVYAKVLAKAGGKSGGGASGAASGRQQTVPLGAAGGAGGGDGGGSDTRVMSTSEYIKRRKELRDAALSHVG